MRYKTILYLVPLYLVFLLVSPVYAASTTQPSQPSSNIQSTTTPTPTSSTTTTPAGSLSALAQDESGIRTIKPLDLDALGNKAVDFGNKSYTFLLKGSVPLFVWGIGISLIIMLLGIVFGKKVILAGITGILITLIVVVLVRYMPEIAISIKSSVAQ